MNDLLAHSQLSKWNNVEFFQERVREMILGKGFTAVTFFVTFLRGRQKSKSYIEKKVDSKKRMSKFSQSTHLLS